MCVDGEMGWEGAYLPQALGSVCVEQDRPSAPAISSSISPSKGLPKGQLLPGHRGRDLRNGLDRANLQGRIERGRAD